MSDEQDLNAQRTGMMEIWHEYGTKLDCQITDNRSRERRLGAFSSISLDERA